MARIETKPFKILDIDQNVGSVTVQFINKFGPLYTGEKKEEELFEVVITPTGDYDNKGNQIYEEKKLPLHNPNEDLTLNVDIPMTADGSFVSSDELLEHIAKHYPEDIFLDSKKRKEAKPKKELSSLVGQEFEINLHYPDPVNYEDFSVQRVEEL
jgi:hypothetical protein